MSKESNNKLIKLIKQGVDTQENYEKLYKQNSGFIYQVIRKRVHGIYEIDDLMQQAFIALVRAVNYYNGDLEETNFLQILKYCIWNELSKSTSELPAHMQYKIIDYRKTYDRLYNELGYKPKTYQIMLEMDIGLKELETIRAAMRQPLSLDEPISEDEETTRMDLYSESNADEELDIIENIEKEVRVKAIHEAINKLHEKHRDIINKRFFKEMTLEEIGQDLNVSRERIRQYEAKAIRKLRNDYTLRKQIIDYSEINEYKTVGVNQFNNTHTSSTEWVVLKREQIRNEQLRKQRQEKYKGMLKEIKGFENLL